MATRYYEQDGFVIKDDGQEQWCLYNPELRDWERDKRAKEAYLYPGYDGFEELTEAEALKAIAKDQQRHDRWEAEYKREHPEEWNKYHPDQLVPVCTKYPR